MKVTFPSIPLWRLPDEIQSVPDLQWLHRVQALPSAASTTVKTIDAAPSGNLVYCATSFGKPFKSEKAFSNWVIKARKKAGLPQRCVAHGLRKVAAKNLAEMGATEYQLMAVMGWTKPDMACVYIEKANRGKMASAAIHKLSEEQNNDRK